MSPSPPSADTERRGVAAARRDLVFGALSNRWRRAILERLRRRPHTTSELSGVLAAAGLSRFAVMQHLRVLEAADLVVSFKGGRARYHHLNPAPLHELAGRWLARFPNRPKRAVRMIKNLSR